MSSIEILQVVPHLPPRLSGVGDYGLLLASELRRAHDIHTHFLIGNPDWEGPPEVEGFPISKVAAPLARSFCEVAARVTGRKIPVLVQYVGYGYEKRGCPIWLLRGLTAWRSGGAARRLATMFHELYATGPVWTSAGLTSGVQRWLTARLARISDVCWTNRRESACELERMRGNNKSAVVFPVFSNFGEETGDRLLAERQPQAVWFGGIRRNVHDEVQTLRQLKTALEKLGVHKIIAIGSNGLNLATLKIPVERRPVQSRQAASALLAASRVGVLDYFDGYLGKSGIFAAYCSHGVVPLLLAPNHSQADGVECGQHFLAISGIASDCSAQTQQVIAANARRWYEAHNLARTAAAWADTIKGLAQPC